ncbi:hypothetical protein N7453_004543 [Penicillium expansum]|nr:hypothetical protein N7453_004543 [Penicillium expansum]
MAYLARTLPKRVLTPSLTQSIRQTRALSTPTLQSTPTTRTPRTNQRHPSPPNLPLSPTRPAPRPLLHKLPNRNPHLRARAPLTLGARDAGFLDVSVQLLPRGEFDLILFWLASRRGLLRGKVEEGGLFRRIAAEKGKDVHELGVEERVRGLLLERLRMNAEVKDVWQDALAQMSLLANIPLSLTELHALASDILTLSGDDSVDATWYTRRLAVSAIYASAEVVMTRDPTPDLVETAEFVERRFEDRKALADKITGIGQYAGFGWNTAIGLGRSWGLKI